MILNTANRTGKAEQLKLDELIRAVDKANNSFMKLEEKNRKEVLKKEAEIKEQLNNDREAM